MGRLRQVAVWATGTMWGFCLTTHLFVVASLSPPRINPLIVGAVGTAALWVVCWPYRCGHFPNVLPPWYAVSLVVASVLCLMWPMAVGSRVPNTTRFLAVFEDTGVPGGPPGDRSLDSHGRRVRALTEEEYQRVQRWGVVSASAFSAGTSGIIFGFILHVRRLGVAPNEVPQQTAGAVGGSGIHSPQVPAVAES